MTVDGVNFPSSGRAMCKFGSIPVAALSRTANQIVCAAPSMRAGMATMEVSINKQDFTITGTQFQFVVPPTVLSINPKSGSARGGTIIAVNGDHFNTEETSMREPTVYFLILQVMVPAMRHTSCHHVCLSVKRPPVIWVNQILRALCQRIPIPLLTCRLSGLHSRLRLRDCTRWRDLN